MIVERIMVRDVACCNTSDTLERAAQLMWDRDCGCIPVVDNDGKIAGVVTDRDACMAAYTKGALLKAVRVEEIMSRQVRTCRMNDDLAEVERRMRTFKVRRLPVVDDADRVVGIISLNDIALAADRGQNKPGFPTTAEVTHTLASICNPPVNA